MKNVLLMLPLAAALAGCGSDGDGTSVSIKGDDGNAVASLGKDGRVAIKAPGFEGSLKLPKFEFGAENFEVDGLKLYPGSTIANLNVESGNDKDGSVRVDFDAPAAVGQVQRWFQDEMQSAGFNLSAKDGMLTGTTKDGSPFTLKLSPAGDEKARGTLSVIGT